MQRESRKHPVSCHHHPCPFGPMLPALVQPSTLGMILRCRSRGKPTTIRSCTSRYIPCASYFVTSFMGCCCCVLPVQHCTGKNGCQGVGSCLFLRNSCGMGLDHRPFRQIRHWPLGSNRQDEHQQPCVRSRYHLGHALSVFRRGELGMM